MVNRGLFANRSCRYHKPNPERLASVDLAVAGDQPGEARGYWLQVARSLRIAGARKRQSALELDGGIAFSVTLPGATRSGCGSWRSGRAAVLVVESAKMRKSDDVAQGRWVNWSWLWALFGQGVHLHRNLSQKQLVFALNLDPAAAIQLFGSVAPTRSRKGQFQNAKAGSILDADQHSHNRVQYPAPKQRDIDENQGKFAKILNANRSSTH